MSKRFGILVVFLIGLGAGRIWNSMAASAGSDPDSAAAVGVAMENGDTNGDGSRDISDAIYLLQWLFAQGPEPAALPARCTSRFVDNGDGTVTDLDSGLMWLQSTADVNGDGTIDVADTVTNNEAYAIAAGFEFAGHSDWRMPTQAVCSTLIVYRDGTTDLDPVFAVEPTVHWAGSSNAGDPCHGAPYVIGFPSGYIALSGDHSSGSRAYVMLVRSP